MKLILHSVSYAGVWKGQECLSLEEFIQRASKLGFDGVELMAKRPHASLLDMDGGEREKIKDLLASNGLECACMAGYTDFTFGAGGGMVPQWELQVSYVANLARLAKDLGCKIVRVFTGSEVDGIPFNEQWDLCVEGLRECARQAARHGVMIGVQNHHDIAVAALSLSHLLREVDQPNCKAMFDAWAPALQGEEIVAAVKAISKDLVYTTVADYIRVPRYKYHPDQVNYSRGLDRTVAVPMGEGIIDYEAFFKALSGIGYDGPVAYEMCSKLRAGGAGDVLDRYAGKFLDYMKRF